MNSAEQAHEMGGFFDDQASHLPEALFLGDTARADWLQLCNRLITAYQQCLACVQPHLEGAARARAAQAAVETALEGSSAALALIEATAEGAGGNHAPHHEYIWTGIGRAYAAAFTSAGLVALQIPTCSPRMTSLAPELARLALRAAETLAHGVGLLLGIRQSGSLAQVCAYIGTLEGQADTLLRTFLTAPARKGRNNSWQGDPHQHAADRQLLTALEAMTDRCEDIGDALLVMAHLAWAEQEIASKEAREKALERT
jgi:hypothetical protein